MLNTLNLLLLTLELNWNLINFINNCNYLPGKVRALVGARKWSRVQLRARLLCSISICTEQEGAVVPTVHQLQPQTRLLEFLTWKEGAEEVLRETRYLATLDVRFVSLQLEVRGKWWVIVTVPACRTTLKEESCALFGFARCQRNRLFFFSENR